MVDEQAQLVDNIFTDTWLCNTDKVSLSVVQQIDYSPKLIDFQQQASGGINDNNIVTRTEDNPNLEGLMDMVYNVPRVTIDMAAEGNSNLIRREDAYLTIADIADILEGQGSLVLKNPIDALIITENINKYLIFVRTEISISPHYKQPPLEDMESLRNVHKLLSTIVDTYKRKGMGRTPMDLLLGLGSTATGMRNTTNPVVELDGASQVTRFGILTKNGVDPYDIK